MYFMSNYINIDYMFNLNIVNYDLHTYKYSKKPYLVKKSAYIYILFDVSF